MDHELILIKISVSEKQWKQSKDELDSVSAEHSDTKDKLDQLERQTFLEELRNRVRGHMQHADLKMSSRANSESRTKNIDSVNLPHLHAVILAF